VLRRLGISTWIYYHEKYLDAIYKKMRGSDIST